MSNLKTIEFIVGDGEVQIEASGFKGGACEAASKAFEDALGGNVTGKKRKAEFYQAAPTQKLTTGGKSNG